MDFHAIAIVIVILFWIFKGIYNFFKAIANSVKKGNTTPGVFGQKPEAPARTPTSTPAQFGQNPTAPSQYGQSAAGTKRPAPVPARKDTRRITNDAVSTAPVKDKFPDLSAPEPSVPYVAETAFDIPSAANGPQPATTPDLIDLLKTPNNLVGAIILQEILGPPRSKR